MLRCSWQYTNTDPKNVAVITPTFRRQLDITDPTSGVDAKQLCDDLAAALQTYVGKVTPFKVTAYNLEGPKPRYPLAQTVLNGAVAPVDPGVAPELAGVLSFYADQNIPRRRGRLYIPLWLRSTAVGTSLSSTQRTDVGNFVSRFAALGGTNVDWGVWSRSDNAFHKATNWFVSDAWGTVRSRGIKETTRTLGTTSG
jgi:hypothetical protein